MEKLETIFKIIIKTRKPFKDTTYLDTLLDFIKGMECDAILSLPSTHPLLSLVYEDIEIHPMIYSFILRLTGILLSNQDTMTKLMEQKHSYFQKIPDFPKSKAFDDATVKTRYLNLINCILNHSTGRQYVYSSGVWLSVASVHQNNSNVYVSKEVDEVLTNLLMKGTTEMRRDIIRHLTGIALSEKILTLLVVILEKTLQKNIDLLSLLKDAGLQEKVKELKVSRSTSLLRMLILFKTIQEQCGRGSSEEKLMEAIQGQVDNMAEIIQQHVEQPLDIIHIVCCAQKWWAYLNDMQLHEHTTDAKIAMQLWLLSFQMAPIIQYCKSFNLQNSDVSYDKIMLLEDGLKDNDQSIQTLPPPLLKTFNSMIEGIQNPTKTQIPISAVSALQKCSSLYVKRNAIAVVALLLTLVVVLTEADEIPVPGFYIRVLGVLNSMADWYRVTVVECFATKCLMGLLVALLEKGLDPSVQPHILKSIQYSINRDAFPLELLLNLMDKDPCSATMKVLPPLLIHKLQHLDWHIRDSVLELLNTFVTAAHNKVERMSTYLRDEGLVKSALICLDDGDSYVRGSAATLVGSSVTVSCLWQQIYATDPKVIEKLEGMALTDDDATVRRASSRALVTAYERGLRGKLDMDELAWALSRDLDVEVKVSAIQLLDVLTRYFLNEAGMVDGCFPPSTFDQKTHRVVTLTEDSVKNRLTQVVVKMCQNGAMVVLFDALDDYDSEVRQKGGQSLKHLSEILSKHGVTNEEKKEDGNKSQNSVEEDGTIKCCNSLTDPSVNIDPEFSKDTVSKEDTLQNGGSSKISQEEREKALEAVLNSSDMQSVSEMTTGGIRSGSREIPQRPPPMPVKECLKKLDGRVRALSLDNSHLSDPYLRNMSSLLDDMLLSSGEKIDLVIKDCY